MNTTIRYTIRGLPVLLLAGGMAMVALRQNAIARLRADNQTLVKESHEAQQLAKENADIPRLRNALADADKLRQEDTELLRLRSEAGQLRKQSADLDKLRAENQQLKAEVEAVSAQSSSANAPPALPGFITRANLSNAGMSTPENTIQTTFWALTQGRFDIMAQCMMDKEMAGKQLTSEQLQAQGEEMSREFSAFPGFGIVGKTNLAPDEVSITLQTSAAGAPLTMKLKYDGSQWKLEQ